MNTPEFGKIPPQNIEAELMVLGTILISPQVFEEVSEYLSPEAFYKPAHQIIYRAICNIKLKSEELDALMVVNHLRKTGELEQAGGASAISKITDNSTFSYKEHALLVAEKYMKRQMILMANEVTKSAYDEWTDPFDLVEQTQNKLEKIVNFPTNDLSPAGRLNEARKAIYAAHENDGLAGVSTGLKTLDSFMGGLMPGDLIVIGGHPGSLKTALTLVLAHNVESQKPALLFEQEMSGRQVGMREISMTTAIPTEKLKTGNVTQDELRQIEYSIGQLCDRRVLIDLASGSTIGYIKNRTRKIHRKTPLGLVAIDYLGLMNLEERKYGDREKAIDHTMAQFKIMAKTLDIPVIVLSQFTKESDGKITPPDASMLKGSGSIKAHAEVVMLLWNPGAKDRNFNYEGVNAEGKLAILFDKNRQGRTGMMWLTANPAINTFSDVRYEQLPEY